MSFRILIAILIEVNRPSTASADSIHCGGMGTPFENIGCAIRKHRELKGLSQSHVAELAGIDRAYFGKLERGEANMSVGVLLAVANGLQVPVTALLEGIDD